MSLITIYNEIAIRRTDVMSMGRCYLKMMNGKATWTSIRDADRFSLDDRENVKLKLYLLEQMNIPVTGTYITVEIGGQDCIIS